MKLEREGEFSLPLDEPIFIIGLLRHHFSLMRFPERFSGSDLVQTILLGLGAVGASWVPVLLAVVVE